MFDLLLYVVCFTDSQAPGLHAYRYNPATGALTPLAAIGKGVANPIYACADPAKRVLYVIDVVDECDGTPGGAVAAFRIEHDTGKLTLINRKPSRGCGPCYIDVHQSGKFVTVASYNSGSVSVLPIRDDGSLGDAASVVEHDPNGGNAKAHCFRFDPAHRFALAADLGIDQIKVYRFDAATGVITPNDPPFLSAAKGAGPRHLAFSPSGRFAYCQTEYDNTMIAMAYDGGAGSLSLIEAQPTVPADCTETSYGSDVHVHPTGRFVYGTNRGHESIAVFRADAATGKLTLVEHVPTQGNFPRGFVIDPAGQFMLVGNEKSDNIVTFSIDQQTGKLTPTGQVTDVAKPVCFVFL